MYLAGQWTTPPIHRGSAKKNSAWYAEDINRAPAIRALQKLDIIGVMVGC